MLHFVGDEVGLTRQEHVTECGRVNHRSVRVGYSSCSDARERCGEHAYQQSARQHPNVICSLLILLHVCVRAGVLGRRPIRRICPAVRITRFYRPTGHLTLLCRTHSEKHYYVAGARIKAVFVIRPAAAKAEYVTLGRRMSRSSMLHRNQCPRG